MGYCDILYRRENIIGYTGNLDSNPTVYFVTESRDDKGGLKTKDVNGVAQILFLNGHITQDHPNKKNKGREVATESYSYSIMNVGPDKISGFDPSKIKGKQLQETYHSSEVAPDNKRYFPTPDGFSDFHVSRNTFTQVSWKDGATMDKLAKSISRFPGIKAMYGAKDDDYIEHL